MRAYLTMARCTAGTLWTYRANFLLGLLGMAFQLFALLAVWRVLLRSGRDLGGYGWPEMKAYLLIAFVTGGMLGVFGGEFRMAERIRSGMVALDLVKPVDYQHARFAEAAGGVGFELLALGGAAAVLLALTGPAAAPEPAHGVLFAISIMLVIPIKFGIIFLSTLACFWTENYMGVSWARGAVVTLFAGALVPLSFFPGWLEAIALSLPFASITSTPALIYLGHAAGGDAVKLLAAQAGWALAMWFGGRLAWRRAVRQLTVHGG